MSKVTMMREHTVYVVGGGMEYIRMFHTAGYKGAKDVQEADIVCFTGGEDVDPQLYGERPLITTFFNTSRDKREIEIYAQAMEQGKPCVGICRGGQFLNVMNGGKMWQHVEGHGIMGTHKVLDLETGKEFDVTSTHHQMMIPHESGKVLAAAAISPHKMSFGSEYKRTEEDLYDDTEAVWYKDTSCLCFQPHPEYGESKQCTDLFFSYVDKFILGGA